MENKINIFNRYSVVVPNGLKDCKGVNLNTETLSLTDEKQSFVIYFEDGMNLLDMNYETEESSPSVNIQCCKYGKYINMRRKEKGDYGYFHFELDAEDGSVWYLPGKMTVAPGYEWSENIEPVLMELLRDIEIIEP